MHMGMNAFDCQNLYMCRQLRGRNAATSLLDAVLHVVLYIGMHVYTCVGVLYIIIPTGDLLTFCIDHWY